MGEFLQPLLDDSFKSWVYIPLCVEVSIANRDCSHHLHRETQSIFEVAMFKVIFLLKYSYQRQTEMFFCFRAEQTRTGN